MRDIFVRNIQSDEDYFINYIIQNFDDEFKNEVFKICSNKVEDALTKNGETKKNSNLTMVSGDRTQFIKGQEGPSFTNGGTTIDPKTGYPNPMYGFYMMPPNMQNYQNFYYVPFPIFANPYNTTTSKNEETSDNKK